MAKGKFLDNLTVVSISLAMIAIGLALTSGSLPIVLFGYALPLLILQIAGWTIVVTSIWGLIQKGMKLFNL